MDLSKQERMKVVRNLRTGAVPKKPDALFTLDHLISVVQLRLSNAMGSPLKRSEVKDIIKIVCLSFIDLAKDNVPLFLQGLFKMSSFTNKASGKKVVKMRLSNVLVELINKGDPLFPDDNKLKTMEELAIISRSSSFKESALNELHLRDRVKKKLGLSIKNINSLKKDLTQHVNHGIIDKLSQTDNKPTINLDNGKGVDSNVITKTNEVQEDDWTFSDLV